MVTSSSRQFSCPIRPVTFSLWPDFLSLVATVICFDCTIKTWWNPDGAHDYKSLQWWSPSSTTEHPLIAILNGKTFTTWIYFAVYFMKDQDWLEKKKELFYLFSCRPWSSKSQVDVLCSGALIFGCGSSLLSCFCLLLLFIFSLPVKWLKELQCWIGWKNKKHSTRDQDLLAQLSNVEYWIWKTCGPHHRIWNLEIIAKGYII